MEQIPRSSSSRLLDALQRAVEHGDLFETGRDRSGNVSRRGEGALWRTSSSARHELAGPALRRTTIPNAGEGPAPSKENPFSERCDAVDRAQRTHRPAAFAFGVVKKYGDDNGGSLAALLTYYGFLSVFPLLLVLVTLLGLVVGSYPGLEQHIVNSALSQFPVIGDKLGSNIKTLHRNSPFGLAIGLLGLIWGSTGVSQSAQYAMAQVWNIPKISRPGFLPRLGRSGLLFAVGGVFLVVSSGLAGVATFSGAQSVVVPDRRSIAERRRRRGAHGHRLSHSHPRRRSSGATSCPERYWPGSCGRSSRPAGVFLMDHELRNVSQVYGFFAIVLGILWWIYLAAQIVVYSAELNAVRAHAPMAAQPHTAAPHRRRP